MNGDDWLGLAILALMVGALCIGPQLWIFDIKPRRDRKP